MVFPKRTFHESGERFRAKQLPPFPWDIVIADQTLSDAKSHSLRIGAPAGVGGPNLNQQQRLQRHLRLLRNGEIRGRRCSRKAMQE